MQLPQR